MHPPLEKLLPRGLFVLVYRWRTIDRNFVRFLAQENGKTMVTRILFARQKFSSKIENPSCNLPTCNEARTRSNILKTILSNFSELFQSIVTIPRKISNEQTVKQREETLTNAVRTDRNSARIVNKAHDDPQRWKS